MYPESKSYNGVLLCHNVCVRLSLSGCAIYAYIDLICMFVSSEWTTQDALLIVSGTIDALNYIRE